MEFMIIDNQKSLGNGYKEVEMLDRISGFTLTTTFEENTMPDIMQEKFEREYLKVQPFFINGKFVGDNIE